MQRLKGDIILICEHCGLTRPYPRDVDESIPNSVKTIVSQCPECIDGGFGSERWLDVVGREIDWETGEPFYR